MHNDIYILCNRARNGFGLAIIACPPGDSPRKYLAEWLQRKGHRHPWEDSQTYDVEDRLESVTDYSGVVACAEYYGAEVSVGRGRATRYD